ncbi:hypothetical protein B0H66DRAFT_315854 [Apodospora peruviana]|uniref:RRM domain-containing protein n=1 Tax=Apodospora peruviana TaxID=516989 RepID=A0AAE0HZ64_9PEZI|nr:hypothetical protein B0H66DRAFT_315854 [Apodospora peruviana]
MAPELASVDDFFAMESLSRIVHLSNLHASTATSEVEKAARDKLPGVACDFHWVKPPALYTGEHSGKVHVAFANTVNANRAVVAWRDLRIHGKEVKAEKLKTTAGISSACLTQPVQTSATKASKAAIRAACSATTEPQRLLYEDQQSKASKWLNAFKKNDKALAKEIAADRAATGQADPAQVIQDTWIPRNSAAGKATGKDVKAIVTGKGQAENSRPEVVQSNATPKA